MASSHKAPARRTTPKKARTSRTRSAQPVKPREHEERWLLRLYIAGRTPKAVAALANLERICEEHLQGRYHIEIVDLLQNPQLARGDQIIAVPTLVRRLPPPLTKIIGDLSNTERVLVGLDLQRREDG